VTQQLMCPECGRPLARSQEEWLNSHETSAYPNGPLCGTAAEMGPGECRIHTIRRLKARVEQLESAEESRDRSEVLALADVIGEAVAKRMLPDANLDPESLATEVILHGERACEPFVGSNTTMSHSVGLALHRRGYKLRFTNQLRFTNPCFSAAKIKHGPQCGCSAYICAACLGLQPHEQ